MTNLTIAVSFAVLAIWLQRHKRWTKFFKAAQGTVTVKGSYLS